MSNELLSPILPIQTFNSVNLVTIKQLAINHLPSWSRFESFLNGRLSFIEKLTVVSQKWLPQSVNRSWNILVDQDSGTSRQELANCLDSEILYSDSFPNAMSGFTQIALHVDRVNSLPSVRLIHLSGFSRRPLYSLLPE